MSNYRWGTYFHHFKKKGKSIVPLLPITKILNSWTLLGWFKDLVQCLRLVAFAGLPDKNMACTRFVHTYMYILSCLELAHHVPPSSSSQTSHPQVQTALFIGLGALSGYIALKMVFYCWLGTIERFYMSRKDYSLFMLRIPSYWLARRKNMEIILEF